MLRRMLKSRRAFSLIELLVVLVILALLVGLVAPKFLAQTKKGQHAAAVTQIANFKSAISIYMTDHNGEPPKALQDLVTQPTGDNNWKGPYLNDVTTVPKDPWGNEFTYNVPGPSGADYEIISLGADGRPGGDGENADLSSVQQQQGQ